MRSKAFSASNVQINTGDSVLLKYVNTVFNAKIALLHPPLLNISVKDKQKIQMKETNLAI